MLATAVFSVSGNLTNLAAGITSPAKGDVSGRQPRECRQLRPD
jgi:hypothetical protein